MPWRHVTGVLYRFSKRQTPEASLNRMRETAEARRVIRKQCRSNPEWREMGGRKVGLVSPSGSAQAGVICQGNPHLLPCAITGWQQPVGRVASGGICQCNQLCSLQYRVEKHIVMATAAGQGPGVTRKHFSKEAIITWDWRRGRPSWGK